MRIETWIASTVGKLAIAAACVAVGGIGGCVARGKYDAGKIERAEASRDQWKNTAENRKTAIDEINRQAEADLAEAKRRLENAERGAGVLADAASEAERRADAAELALELAGRAKPACASLLAQNLFETCGVKPR